MLIYVGLLGCSAVVAAFGQRLQRRHYAFGLFLLVWILLAFRDNTVGADTQNYINGFLNMRYTTIGNIFVQDEIEYGYLLLVKLLYTIWAQPRFFLAVTSAIVAFCYGWFFYRHASRLYLAFLGYLAFGLFSFHLSGIRQSLAMAICLLAVDRIPKKKLLSFVLIVLLAMLFHRSAILFLVAYPLGRMQVCRRNQLLICSVGLLCVILIEPLMNLFGDMFERYDKYGVESTGNGQIFFVIVLVITLAAEIYKRQILESNPNAGLLLHLNYVNLFLWVARLITRTVERPSFFFMPFTILLMAEVVRAGSVDRRNHILMYTVVACLLCFLFLYRMSIIPYQFGV